MFVFRSRYFLADALLLRLLVSVSSWRLFQNWSDSHLINWSSTGFTVSASMKKLDQWQCCACSHVRPVWFESHNTTLDKYQELSLREGFEIYITCFSPSKSGVWMWQWTGWIQLPVETTIILLPLQRSSSNHQQHPCSGSSNPADNDDDVLSSSPEPRLFQQPAILQYQSPRTNFSFCSV